MGVYNSYILPRLAKCACQIEPMMEQRKKVVPQAVGDVLEIGIGSGLNLPFYSADSVHSLIGIDPSKSSWSLAQTEQLMFPVEYIQASAEELPLASESIDSIVVTYSLCTIPDPVRALSEMKRVLKSSGQILFCEHGAAPDPSVKRWQDRLDPFWSWLAGGCHLNRKIPAFFEEAGLSFRDLHADYVPGWKFVSYNYWGVAHPSRATNDSSS